MIKLKLLNYYEVKYFVNKELKTNKMLAYSKYDAKQRIYFDLGKFFPNIKYNSIEFYSITKL